MYRRGFQEMREAHGWWTAFHWFVLAVTAPPQIKARRKAYWEKWQ